MNIYNRPYDDQIQPRIKMETIRDYMTSQDELFKDLTIDELYEQAKRYQEQKALTAW
ncbi:MAG: hypothetical protein RBT80_25600 [Candidatus Vecturithrix sp.]|jgi:hypothetical protein|nr:hypothetical protein [Candidatus Vecturithrix sp.]